MGEQAQMKPWDAHQCQARHRGGRLGEVVWEASRRSLDKSDLWGRKAGKAFQAEGDTSAYVRQTDPLQEFQDVCDGLHLTEEKTRLWEVKTCPLSQPVDTARAPFRTHSASPRSGAVSTAKGTVTKVKQTSLVPLPQSPLDWGSMSCCRSPF